MKKTTIKKVFYFNFLPDLGYNIKLLKVLIAYFVVIKTEENKESSLNSVSGSNMKRIKVN